MKLRLDRFRPLICVFACLVLLSLTSHAFGQGQRIALLPNLIALLLRPGETRSVDSVCLDSHLPAPKVSEVYGNILTPVPSSSEVVVTVGTGAGKKTLSLPQALAQHIITFRGSGLSEILSERDDIYDRNMYSSYLDVENTDPKHRPVSLKVLKSQVLYPHPGRYEGQEALKVIAKFGKNRSYVSKDGRVKEQQSSDLQDQVWHSADELRGVVRSLIQTGDMSGSVEETRQEVIGASLRRFQRENGLNVTGHPDQATLAKLKQKVTTQYEPLLREVTESLMVKGEPKPTTSRLIRRFQADVELPITGELDVKTQEELRTEMDRQFVEMGIPGKTATDRLHEFKRRNEMPVDERITKLLVDRLDAKWSVIRTTYKLVADADEFTSSLGAGRPILAEGLYESKPPMPGEVLAVHKIYGRSRLDPDEMYILVQGSNGDVELHTLRHLRTEDLDLLGPAYITDKTVLKNADAIDKMDELSRDLAVRKSDAATRIIHAGSYTPLADAGRGEFRLQLGGDKTLTLSSAEHDALLGNDPKVAIPALDEYMHSLKPMPDGSKPRFIVSRDAFAQGRYGHGGGHLPFDAAIEGPQSYAYHESRYQVNPTETTARLNARYGNTVDFFLDDELDLGRKNVDQITKVTQGADIAAYVAPDEPLAGMAGMVERQRPGSGKVEQYNVIKNIQDYLKDAKVHVVGDLKPSSETNVLVLTGHKETDFVDYVDALGQNGVFRNHIVAMASCYEAGDEALNTRIIQRYGAKAVFFFDSRINPNAVEAVLYEMTQILAAPNFSPTRMDDLLNQSIEQALKDSQNSMILDEISKLHRSLIQVSRNDDPNRSIQEVA
jgi:hypothetical protein